MSSATFDSRIHRPVDDLVTVNDIRDAEFRSFLNMYNADDVDDFLDRCAFTVRTLFEVNVRQQEEILHLKDEVSSQREGW